MTGSLLTVTVDEAKVAIAARIRPSVVEVRTARHGGGAGIIWRSDGTIITNYHVAPADSAEVSLADGRTLHAAILGRDEANDLAVLSIPARDLPAAAIGDARTLRPGDLVIAVGHPLGVRYAVTSGVVYASIRKDPATHQREMLHADVRLMPGNSGGPLADARGRVVGVNAMVAGGMGLAVPSHLVERLLARISGRPRLDVETRDVELTPAIANRAAVTAGRGALVIAIRTGGPADRSGLMVGDIIVAIDGRFVDGADGLMEALVDWTSGTIRLGLLRGGNPVEALVEPELDQRRAA